MNSWKPPATSSIWKAVPSCSYMAWSLRTKRRASLASAKPATSANLRGVSGSSAASRAASTMASRASRASFALGGLLVATEQLPINGRQAMIDRHLTWTALFAAVPGEFALETGSCPPFSGPSCHLPNLPIQ